MNINDNFFKENSNFELINLINDINNKFEIKLLEFNSKFTEKLDELDNKLNELNQKIEKNNNRIENCISIINRNNYIENYRNLRMGKVFPYNSILSKEVLDKSEHNYID
jgi:hypothetical protein